MFVESIRYIRIFVLFVMKRQSFETRVRYWIIPGRCQQRNNSRRCSACRSTRSHWPREDEDWQACWSQWFVHVSSPP